MSGLNQTCILKTIQRSVRVLTFKDNLNSINTFKFSTFYTTILQSSFRRIESTFIIIMANIYNYLVLGKDQCCFVKKTQNTLVLTKRSLKLISKCSEVLIDNIFILFSRRVCPIPAYLFLYSYKAAKEALEIHKNTTQTTKTMINTKNRK